MSTPTGYYAAWKEGRGEMAIYRLVWIDRTRHELSRQATLTNYFTVTVEEMEAELKRRNCGATIEPPKPGELS